jgi:hypothetical protein
MQKKIQFFLLSILIFSTFSCDKDSEVINESNSSKLIIKKIHENEIQNNTFLREKLLQIKKTNRNIQEKIVNDENYNFSINTNLATYIDDGEAQTYTFEIIRNNSVNKLENLVLKSTENGEFKTLLIQYDFSKESTLERDFNPNNYNPALYTLINFDYSQIVNSRCENSTGTRVCSESWNYNCTGTIDEGNNNGNIDFTEQCSWVMTTGDCTFVWDNDCGGGSDNLGGLNTSPTDGGPHGGGGNYDDFELIEAENLLLQNFDTQQTNWWNNNSDYSTQQNILAYLIDNNNSNQAIQFLIELIDLARNEVDVELIPNLINLSIVTKQNGYFENPYDSNYYNLINPYTEVDTQIHFPLWYVYFRTECAIARHKLSQEPGWSDLYPWQQNALVYWEASKEMLHLGLDLIGLAPVVGEIADLANGIIYTIEGDGVNASLSYASAIPIAGWFSAGVKFAKRADGLAYTIKAANNLISFGAYNSKKFRQACGIAVGDATKQAHHLIPRGTVLIEHEVVQRAAKATTNQGFHIDQALNGIAVATWRNQPNHNAYNNLIKNKLDALPANLTPNQAYAELMDILNQARQAVINNPNTHINDLIF